jgi:glycosyltransferase involved in cell wall biosynthesis
VNNVTAFVAPSQNLIEQHVRAGYERSRFHLIPHGMPRLEPRLYSHQMRSVIKDSGRNPTLLYAGGPVLIKGVETVLAAAPALTGQLKGFRLLVSGGSMGTYAKRFLALGPSVQMLGSIPFREMPALYTAADLTAMPSTVQESFGLVAAESLVAGTPVVGSQLGGIPEIVDDEDTGYLVPPNDPEAFAERVLEHFSRPANWRRRMRLLCAQKGWELVAWDKHLDRLSRVYESVV